MDFLTAREGDIQGLPDPEVLALGVATGRIIVSSDVNTMPRHFWRFVGAYNIPGLVIVPQSVEVARAIAEIVAMWKDFSAEALENQIRWIRAGS